MDGKPMVVEIGIGDVYDVLIKQVLPAQSETNAHLARLNGTVDMLKDVTSKNTEASDQHELGISKLWTEVSVVKAVAGERVQQQRDNMLQIKETQREGGERVREVAKRVWEATFKLAEIGAVLGLILKFFDVW